MGKYSSGPDEKDVETMMRAMGALHSGVVTLTVSPDGIGSNTGLKMTAMMHFNVLPGSSLPATVVHDSRYPCQNCASFWGHAFNALYGLDALVGKAYEQTELWSK